MTVDLYKISLLVGGHKRTEQQSQTGTSPTSPSCVKSGRAAYGPRRGLAPRQSQTGASPTSQSRGCIVDIQKVARHQSPKRVLASLPYVVADHTGHTSASRLFTMTGISRVPSKLYSFSRAQYRFVVFVDIFICQTTASESSTTARIMISLILFAETCNC